MLYCTVLYCTVLYCRVYSGAVTSPSSVIVQQAGNSLEMSILLVSLLRSAQDQENKNIFAITYDLQVWLSRGFGWDAYVVVGLVDTRTATLDQSHLACPLLTEELEAGEAGEAQGSARPQLYRLQEPVALVSRFQQFLASREESGGQGAATTAASRDSGHQQTLHGWVYVETDNLAFFIEPTTGQRHSIASAAYIKINCLFNDQNYWLNLKEGNLSRKGKKLELDNKSKWLRLIQEVSNKKKPKQEKKTTEIGIGLMKEKFVGGVRVELIFNENIFNIIVPKHCRYLQCSLPPTLHPV